VTISGDNAVWIGTREGAWRWTGEGAAWEHVLNGLAAREVTSIRAEGGLLLAATSNSVFVSRDLGESWKAEPATGFEITGAALHDGTIYVTTRHHGVLARAPNPPLGLLRSPADFIPDGR
jgi:ligand-binding sensor domain-containing protein